MRIAVIALLCVGCASTSSTSSTSSTGSSATDADGCPLEAPASLSACADMDLSCHYDPATTCECDIDTWFCQTQTCPAGIPGPEPVTCTSTDSTCDYSDWEHDCSCGCVDTPAGRYWSCVGDTVGSVCPVPPQT